MLQYSLSFAPKLIIENAEIHQRNETSCRSRIYAAAAMGRSCEGCGGNEIAVDEFSGFPVCHSCGRVADYENFTTAWDFNTAQGTSNFISYEDAGKYSNWYCYSYAERKKAAAQEKLDRITGLLRLAHSQVEEVKFMVNHITKGELGLGRWFDVLVGACSYVRIRMDHLPVTIYEVSAAVECDVFELGRMYVRVLDHMAIGSLPDIDMLVFVQRGIDSVSGFCKVSGQVREKIVESGRILLHCTFQWFLTTGRRSLPVVAAVLAVLGQVYGVSAGIKDVANEFGLPVSTCKARYAEILEGLVKVGQKLPWGKDICVKNVTKHAEMILRYIEVREKNNGKKNGENGGHLDSVGSRQNVMGSNRANSGKSSEVGSGLQFSLGANSANSGRNSEVSSELQFNLVSGRQSDGESQQKIMVVDGKEVENQMNSEVDEVQNQLCAESLALVYGDFSKRLSSLRAIAAESEAKMMREKEQNAETSKQNTRQSSPRKGQRRPYKRLSRDKMLEIQATSDALPPAFLASKKARSLRREKIKRAKARLEAVRNSLTGKKNCNEKPLECTDSNNSFVSDSFMSVNDTEVCSNSGARPRERPSTARDTEGESKRRKLSTSNLDGESKTTDSESQSSKTVVDWEDSMIECLLLHGADEKEIEEGYYRTLLTQYVFKSDSSCLSDKEIQKHIRPVWEVTMLSSLYEQEPSYPWLKKDEM